LVQWVALAGHVALVVHAWHVVDPVAMLSK
jgi:hypothetical protein